MWEAVFVDVGVAGTIISESHLVHQFEVIYKHILMQFQLSPFFS